jgi:hypothetical protein
LPILKCSSTLDTKWVLPRRTYSSLVTQRTRRARIAIASIVCLWSEGSCNGVVWLAPIAYVSASICAHLRAKPRWPNVFGACELLQDASMCSSVAALSDKQSSARSGRCLHTCVRQWQFFHTDCMAHGSPIDLSHASVDGRASPCRKPSDSNVAIEGMMGVRSNALRTPLLVDRYPGSSLSPRKFRISGPGTQARWTRSSSDGRLYHLEASFPMLHLSAV